MCKNCDNGDYPIGAVWWRTSTKGQTELSPATQIKEAKVMLEDQGYVVPDERVIGADWTSLAILDCPKMETLLSWVRHGEIHAIERVSEVGAGDGMLLGVPSGRQQLRRC